VDGLRDPAMPLASEVEITARRTAAAQPARFGPITPRVIGRTAPGWLLPFAAQMILHLRSGAASPDHAARPRRRRQDPAAGTGMPDAMRITVFGERIVDQGADQSRSVRSKLSSRGVTQPSTTSPVARTGP